jgi:diaminopropionate ammonia-lyase
VIVQAGVGSFAGAAAIYFSRKYGSERPKMVCVEPLEADCMLASISSAGGKPGTSEGSLDTIMSCLNCARPSLFTWQVNRETYDVFIAVDDSWAEQAMRLLYSPPGGEQCLISGEAGCAGVAGLLALLQEQVLSEAARHLGINENSRVLVFSTEGDNDPETYSQIVNI